MIKGGEGRGRRLALFLAVSPSHAVILRPHAGIVVRLLDPRRPLFPRAACDQAGISVL